MKDILELILNFYNYINKYGIEQLEFGCLLVVRNYTDM